MNISEVLQTTKLGKYRTALHVTLEEAILEIPVNVVIGSKAGPTSLLMAAVHGDEFDGPEAIRRFTQSIEPAQVTGRIILIPVVNVPAYLAALRRSPEDDIDMSGAWHEDAPDTQTRRIALAIQREVLPHVDQLLDMHGGGDIFDIHRLAMYHVPEDPELAKRILKAACGLGIKLLWRFPRSRGLSDYMASLGKVAIGVEIGGEARLREEAVRDNLQALINFLINGGNLPGIPVLPRYWQVIEGRPDHSEHAGFLQPFVRMGEQVVANQRIGLISDMNGAALEEVSAKFDGIITTIRTKPILPSGGATFQVSKPVERIHNPKYEEMKK